MYLSNDDIGIAKTILSNDEITFGRITTKKLKTILDNHQVKLGRFHIDSNSFGEFLFVSFSIGELSLFVWGLGYHNYRNVYYTDEWFLSTGNGVKKTSTIYSKDVLYEMMEERMEIINTESKNHENSDEHSTLFTALADMCDDDYALSNIDDFYAYFNNK